LAIKIFLFITNYSKKLRMRANIRRKEKVKMVTEFAERMKKVQKKGGTTLRKA